MPLQLRYEFLFSKPPDFALLRSAIDLRVFNYSLGTKYSVHASLLLSSRRLFVKMRLIEVREYDILSSFNLSNSRSHNKQTFGVAAGRSNTSGPDCGTEKSVGVSSSGMGKMASCYRKASFSATNSRRGVKKACRKDNRVGKRCITGAIR